MEAVRAGDPTAFQALYERHRRVMFAFLLRSVADRPTAEDLLQETFLRVFTRREGYRPTAAFRTWLFTIARNLLIDRFRKTRGTTGVNGTAALETVPAPDASPLERAGARELAERLEAGVRQLPPSQREILLLSRFAGLNHQEVAEVTGASPEGVRVALHRALRRLRAQLGPL
ncbi:MAG: RNA polymerase sigma factor [Candidatus Rokuibacteriota bacterium]